MGADLKSDEELKELLREMVASNMTVAYQLELIRRALQPSQEKLHPLAQVLEHFDLLQEVMNSPDDLDGEDSINEDPLDDTPGRSGLASMLAGSPFASTLKYVRPSRRTGNN